jgi:hypothetical protein
MDLTADFTLSGADVGTPIVATRRQSDPRMHCTARLISRGSRALSSGLDLQHQCLTCLSYCPARGVYIMGVLC